MPRTPVTTNYSTRVWITFLMTELLDFLMTEDWDYIITDDSLLTWYTNRTPVTTNYS